MKEIEILVEVYSNIEDCKKELSNYEFKGTNEVIDIYYYDPLREYLKPNEKNEINQCMRLRKKDDKNYITYKVDKFDDNNIWLYSDEYETEVEDFDKIQEIIKLLGLKELLTIHNKKSLYNTDKYEIALEEVKDLGTFLEVEYCTNEDVDVVLVKKDIQEFINNLNIEVSEELHMGKPEMMLNKINC